MLLATLTCSQHASKRWMTWASHSLFEGTVGRLRVTHRLRLASGTRLQLCSNYGIIAKAERSNDAVGRALGYG